MNSKNTHALVLWVDEKNYSVVKTGDVFLKQDDDEIILEEVYRIKQGLNVYEGLVKFVGTKEQCDKHLKQITTYKQTLPEKNNVKKTKLNILNTESSIKVSKTKVSLVKGKNKKTNDDFSDESVHESVSESVDESKRKLEERDSLISSLEKKMDEQNKEMVKLREEADTYKALSNPDFLKNFVPLCVQVMKYVATESERDEVRRFGGVPDEILIDVKFPGKYMSRNLFDRVSTMISDNKSATCIYRTMATSLVPDTTIWGSNYGFYMRETYSELKAAKAFMLTRGVRLTESDFKTTLRNLCSESRPDELKNKTKSKSKQQPNKSTA